VAENSKIEWTDHTFNPWRGCSKVHAGCAHCYAESLSGRNPGTLGVWGPNGTRVVAAESAWKQPVKWNRQAILRCLECGSTSLPEPMSRGALIGDHGWEFECQCGASKYSVQRQKVFCASLADVFEDWPGPMMVSGKQPIYLGKDFRASSGERLTMADVRARLFALIDATPNLDWIILTKRPENVLRMWPALVCEHCAENRCGFHRANAAMGGNSETFRDNVWLLTSVSDQATADVMIPELLKCRDLVPVLGVSAEPLLGPVDLRYLQPRDPAVEIDALNGTHGVYRPHQGKSARLDWVICGGESGYQARPLHPDWARALRDQCSAAGVPYFFKQWGEWASQLATGDLGTLQPREIQRIHQQSESSGRVMFMCSNGATNPFDGGKNRETFFRVGKKLAGNLLDGRQHLEFPKSYHHVQRKGRCANESPK